MSSFLLSPENSPGPDFLAPGEHRFSEVPEGKSASLPRIPGLVSLQTLGEMATAASDGLPLRQKSWDLILEGGRFPRRLVTECVVAGAGAGLLSGALIQAARGEGWFAALVDASDAFSPDTLGDPWLEHLLWVRCAGLEQALKAADILARDVNFGLLLLDLAGMPVAHLRRVPTGRWYRLQRAVERNQSILVVFTPVAVVSSARLRLRLGRRICLDDLAREREELLDSLRPEVLRGENPARRAAG